MKPTFYGPSGRRPAFGGTSVFLFAVAGLASVLSLGCGSDKEYVRGAHDPSIDNAAMSTGLDKDDVQRALHTLLDHMRTAPIMDRWRSNGGNSKVAIAPFKNETSEHIDSQLQALLGETETWLVNSGTVTMISQERQLDMIRETERTQHPVFDHSQIPRYGRQLGVSYYVTGKVQAADERTRDARRVQYWLFMQVIEVETSAVRWEQKAEITKMVR